MPSKRAIHIIYIFISLLNAFFISVAALCASSNQGFMFVIVFFLTLFLLLSIHLIFYRLNIYSSRKTAILIHSLHFVIIAVAFGMIAYYISTWGIWGLQKTPAVENYDMKLFGLYTIIFLFVTWISTKKILEYRYKS